MKKIFFILNFVLCLAAWGSAFGAADRDNNGKLYPFFPSLFNTTAGGPVESKTFTPPNVCEECHSDIYDQWKGSMHANAWEDPVFQALWRMGNEETAGLTEKLCAGCHTAIGVVSEEILARGEDGDYMISEIAQRGVQCDVCHSVKEATFLDAEGHEPHNGTLLLDPGSPKKGPYKDSASPYHESEYSELHTKAEFCANCHHVFHPVNNFPIERTYDEWKYSVYAQNGIVCQDCHMATVEDSIETARTLKKVKRPGKAAWEGPERDHVYPHFFVGGNFTVTALLGADTHAEMARKRLQSAAKVEIIKPEELESGEVGAVKVKVTNVGAGHNLPTSLTEVRQMWLDVRVTDALGTVLVSSGWLDKEHNIEPEAVVYNSSAMDKDGHHTIKPWEVVRFEYNKTIQPKGSATETYSFAVPDKSKFPLTATAVLRYRSYPQKVANMLLGKDAPVLPIVDMARDKVEITALETHGEAEVPIGDFH